jgi:hypothetical protein
LIKIGSVVGTAGGQFGQSSKCFKVHHHSASFRNFSLSTYATCTQRRPLGVIAMKRYLEAPTFTALMGSLTLFRIGSAANAGMVAMNFDTLQNNELVNSYYNGGLGSLGSGPGPNYGVIFTNAFVLNEFSNNEGLLVTLPNSITFLSGSGAIMNVAAGFKGGFSFNYSAPFDTGSVLVYGGLNGTGPVLATLSLPLTNNGASTPGCGGHNYCPVVAEGVTFAGTAESVNFSGTANFVVYDDITLGSSTPVVTPLPAALPLFVTGLGAMGYLAGARSGRLRLSLRDRSTKRRKGLKTPTPPATPPPASNRGCRRASSSRASSRLP